MCVLCVRMQVLQTTYGTPDIGQEIDLIVRNIEDGSSHGFVGSLRDLFSDEHGKQAFASVAISIFQYVTPCCAELSVQPSMQDRPDGCAWVPDAGIALACRLSGFMPPGAGLLACAAPEA